jgi:hypothetical protein
MYPALTVCASLGATVTMLALCVTAGMDARSTQFFVGWTSLPYVAYCILAFVRHQTRSCGLVFVGTAVSAALALLIYAADFTPIIGARSTGEVVMNCGGPLIELCFPIVQWLFAGLPWLASLPRRSKPHVG